MGRDGTAARTDDRFELGALAASGVQITFDDFERAPQFGDARLEFGDDDNVCVVGREGGGVGRASSAPKVWREGTTGFEPTLTEHTLAHTGDRVSDHLRLLLSLVLSVAWCGGRLLPA